MKRAYTIGRGQLLFKRANDPSFWKVGNAKEFTVEFSVEKKEHYSTESGLKVKDAEIIVSVDANVSFVLDEMRKETVAMFLLGTTQDASQTAQTGVSVQLQGVQPGFYYDLQNRNLSNVTVTDGGTTTFNEGTDYEVDTRSGLLYIPETSNIPAGTNITVTFDVGSDSAELINSGQLYNIEGELWFVADPPTGAVVDIRGNVQLSPEGELQLIGDDFLTLAFKGTFTKESATRIFRALYREVR